MTLRDFLIVILGAIIFAGVLLKIFPDKQSTAFIISPLAAATTQASDFINSIAGLGLKDVVEKSLKGTRGTYGIVIKNLRTGETYMQNENKSFESASLYKLWVMAKTYDLVDKGDLKHDQTLSKGIPELNRIFQIDEDSAELKEGTITQTINVALEQMITISSNYSALLLSQKIGISKIGSFISALGLSNSKMGSPPMTTPTDIALFYQMLYDGKIVNEASSQKMMELLERQELNDRIPKFLPVGTKIAHKTGELDGYKHDAGIIFARDPILVVLMSESDAPLGAAEREANLARDVYNYFENK